MDISGIDYLGLDCVLKRSSTEIISDCLDAETARTIQV